MVAAKPAVQADASDVLIAEALKKFDLPGPRYTSYPTADRFFDGVRENQLLEALKRRQLTGSSVPLSLYIHIPFCESLCFYCACNKIITKRHERGTEYLHYLEKEMRLYVKHLGKGQPVSQLHLGGGSPTFLSDDELSWLMSTLQENFHFLPEGEYSIEIDPRTVDGHRLQHLSNLGFNRLSFGVQDFAPEVQQAVHRIQPLDKVAFLMDQARELEFDSINVDLIYGLPKQTLTSFEQTIRQTIALKPDRIALYAYAHLPERFKPQRQIQSAELPEARAKIAMLNMALSLFLSAGYVYVGMDHFALPDDTLAKAKRQGALHRNFQGYTTLPDSDLIALGVSAIGKVGGFYSQNAKTVDAYYSSLDQGHLPVSRGLAMTADDHIRYTVIMAIMCQGRVEFDQIESAYGINFRRYFAHELQALEPLQEDGLVRLEANAVQVTSLGWYFVRGVAMQFDYYLQAGKSQAKFSKIV